MTKKYLLFDQIVSDLEIIAIFEVALLPSHASFHYINQSQSLKNATPKMAIISESDKIGSNQKYFPAIYRVTRSKWDRAIFSEMGLQNTIFAI